MLIKIHQIFTSMFFYQIDHIYGQRLVKNMFNFYSQLDPPWRIYILTFHCQHTATLKSPQSAYLTARHICQIKLYIEVLYTNQAFSAKTSSSHS